VGLHPTRACTLHSASQMYTRKEVNRHHSAAAMQRSHALDCHLRPSSCTHTPGHRREGKSGGRAGGDHSHRTCKAHAWARAAVDHAHPTAEKPELVVHLNQLVRCPRHIVLLTGTAHVCIFISTCCEKPAPCLP
jgi:hypothetical protein